MDQSLGRVTEPTTEAGGPDAPEAASSPDAPDASTVGVDGVGVEQVTQEHGVLRECAR